MTILFPDPFAGTGQIDDGVNWDSIVNAVWTAGSGIAKVASGSLSSDWMIDCIGATWPADQYAQVTLSNPAASGAGTGYGAAVRITSAGGGTFYRLVGNASGWELTRWAAGSFVASIASGSSPTFANGDTLRLEVQGTTLRGIKNGGAAFTTQTDANIATGHAGMSYSSTEGTTPGIEAFEGGDFTGGSNTTITPSVGALAAAGVAALVTQQIARVALVGALSLSGSAPSVNVQGIVRPNTGAVAITGAAPVLNVQGTIRPNAGALALSGNAPTVIAQLQVRPNAGTLALSGNAPTLATSGNVTRTPSVGALAFTGYVSPQTLTVPSPDSGTLSLTGAAPSVKLGILRRPTVGSLTLTGIAATVRQGAVRQPTVGSLTVNGIAASVTIQGSPTITPSVGSLTITGQSANVANSSAASRTPLTASLSLTGAAPTLGQLHVRRPAVAALALTGSAPVVTQTGTEDLRVIVPYLIGSLQAPAEAVIRALFCVPSVTGTTGTVTAQSPDAFTLVERGTTINITLGGAINNPGRRRRGGQIPYGSGIY